MSTKNIGFLSHEYYSFLHCLHYITYRHSLNKNVGNDLWETILININPNIPVDRWMLHIAVKILCRCNDQGSHTLVIFKFKKLSRVLNFFSQIYTFSRISRTCMDPEWFICKILRELIFPDLCDAIHASRTPHNILVTARTTWSGKTECGTRRLICQDRKRETRSLPINAFLWLTRHTQLHMHGHEHADR